MKTLVAIICMVIAALPGSLSNEPPLLTTSSPYGGPIKQFKYPELGDCQLCRVLVDSFNLGLERTSNGNYTEEKKANTYDRTPMRLFEILEELCQEQGRYAGQCYKMIDRSIAYIREWWEKTDEVSEDFLKFICITSLEVCCPQYHYGKDCTPCPGYPDNICGGHGKCRGDGTRKGNGTCLCNTGFTGKYCGRCAKGYYLSYIDDFTMTCVRCHIFCKGGCLAGSQRDCLACQPGLKFDANEGCMDIDECFEKKNPCKKNEHCVNSIGSYDCASCDEACETCEGDGPSMCIDCAVGYTKIDGTCEIESLDDLEDLEYMDDLTDMIMEDEYYTASSVVRYSVYAGLLVGTGVLLMAYRTLGTIVGGLTLIYVLGAEFHCWLYGYQCILNMEAFDIMTLLSNI